MFEVGSGWWIAGTLLTIYILIPVFLWLVTPPQPTQADLTRRKRAIVLVLGDVGRSPRMNYHALSLAKGGLDVDLCGYAESKLLPEVEQNERITLHAIPQITNPGLPFVLFAVRKVILQHWYLYKLLRKLKGAEYLLVQNPPSIPVLGMSRFFCLFMSQRTRLVVDWHNFGYSILALKLGLKHPFTTIYRWYEMIFGRVAYCHFTVTVAMARALEKDFRMTARRIVPLHDRPAHVFHPLDAREKAEVLKSHPDLFGDLKPDEKIVVTSTSYTPDEDLYTLLDALDKYEQKCNVPLRVIITGRGPMYDEIQAAIAKRDGKKTVIKQAWLASEDYPLVVGCADIGVSLHYSSSGIDLPMKVVDMFGCGVPVIALGFTAIDELVKANKNGVVVKGADDMAVALEAVFTKKVLMDAIKKGAMQEAAEKWDTNWSGKVGPLFGIGEYENGAAYDDSSSSDSDHE